VRFHALTIPQLNAAIASAIEGSSRCIIGCFNLHSVYLYHRDAHMRRFYEMTDWVHIDGMALVAVARLLGYPVLREHRVTWLDWLDPLLALAAAHRWRVYYLGSAPGVAEQAAAALRQRHPGLLMQTRPGYFDARPDSADSSAIRDHINQFQPHLLMVGMGQPRQEKWVADNAHLVSANAIVTPGACLDYVAGRIPRPWRFLGRLGLEWAFRLATEPRRLGRRYLLEPWALAPYLLADVKRAALRRRS
jgi:N-acetylglucosaminyldiphosphoundecaprenol N-acetyl-beta-D-mannosaminyltransferase